MRGRSTYTGTNVASKKLRRDLDLGGEMAEQVVEGMKSVYKKAVLPLEKDYKYDLFFNDALSDVDFDSKPLVLVLGQYSVGKTSFIKHLIGRDFPGMRVGPEPTTDRFSCVYYGDEDATVPGSVLQMSPDLPFRGLHQFGASFLNKFEGSRTNSPALKSLMFVDSPGVLSGKKQKNRQYDFKEVTEWFADRAARILLFFDCNKLDISDEFKAVIKVLRKHDDKIRVVLNKADSMAERELIRVYGALQWSLGKVFDTPEVLKVYISSFHDRPMDRNNYLHSMFEGDGNELIGELKALPKQAAMEKVNELLKRMRLVKLHCQIMIELRRDVPRFFGKKKKQRKLLENLENQFRRIARKLHVNPADFPNLKHFKSVLMKEDLAKYPRLSQRKFRTLDYAMEKTLPALVKKLMDQQTKQDQFNPFDDQEEGSSIKSGEALRDLDAQIMRINDKGSVYEPSVYEAAALRGDHLDRMSRSSFRQKRRSHKSAGGTEWVVNMKDKADADSIFFDQKLVNGKLTGESARNAFSSLGLSDPVLHRIWMLVDFDKKNQLDADQFALALWLGKNVIKGVDLPAQLTYAMLPPGNRL